MELKILQIIPSFGVGGAEKLVLDYMMYFDKSKNSIKAISMYGIQDTIFDRLIKDNGIDVVYLNKKLGFDLSMFKKVDAIIKEFQPDIIHSHMYTMKYIIPSVINNKKIKLFHTIHNEPEKDATGVNRVANKIAFKYLNCTPIALTAEMAIKVNNYYNISNTEVINNGIYLNKFKDVTESKEEIRNMFDIPKDSFVIGHIGRFSKQKNHDFLVDIYKQYYEKDNNSRLVLVGDGELKSEIEYKVASLGLEKNVRFLGQRKDIPKILKLMDAFVFPSIYEGFPITLIEAQASGVRCVISDKIDIRVILSEDTVSVSLNDTPEKWCAVIRDKSVKSKPSGTIESFDIKNVVKELEKLYNFTAKDRF